MDVHASMRVDAISRARTRCSTLTRTHTHTHTHITLMHPSCWQRACTRTLTWWGCLCALHHHAACLPLFTMSWFGVGELSQHQNQSPRSVSRPSGRETPTHTAICSTPQPSSACPCALRNRVLSRVCQRASYYTLYLEVDVAGRYATAHGGALLVRRMHSHLALFREI